MEDTRFHYLPAMTRRNGDRQQAICGSWIVPAQHRTDPDVVTCWGCKMWLENVGVPDSEDETCPAV